MSVEVLELVDVIAGKESSAEVGEMLNVELRDIEPATVLDGDAENVVEGDGFEPT